MHRYLYANSNPFMYVDPTGRVAWLKKVADWFGDGADAAIDIASDLDFGDGTFADAAESYVAFSLGNLAGFQRVAEGVVSMANTTANVTIVASGLAIRATGLGEADYAVEALGELNELEEDIGTAVAFAKEASKNPGKVLKAAGSATQDYAARVLSGDKRAIAQGSAVATEFILGIATGNATQQTMKGSAELGETVVEQTIKQSKKARKASVLVEGKKTPKTAPKKIKAPDSPGGGSKGPTPGSQKFAAKDAQIQKQIRRAELDQKFGRSGNLNAEISSGRGYSQSNAAKNVDLPNTIRNAQGRLIDADTKRFVSDPNNPPSPYTFTDAQRRAAWKRLAKDPKSGLSASERAQIQARGNRGPQRMNEFGELETMELSHEPIPLRDGGTEVVPRWPADHAAVDPHRHLKKR